MDNFYKEDKDYLALKEELIKRTDFILVDKMIQVIGKAIDYGIDTMVIPTVKVKKG